MKYTIPNKPYTQMNRGERRAFKRWMEELKQAYTIPKEEQQTFDKWAENINP
jgi:hypothetical protein